MKKLILSVAALGVVVSFAASTSAREIDRARHAERSEARFNDADLDSDGALTSEEVTAMLTAWEAKKAERNGETPRDIRPRRITRYIDKRDTDSNGQVEQAEYMAERVAWFDERDANQDGVLSDDERKRR